MSTDVLISQLPMLPDYVEGARSYWQSTRHPQNVSDIMEAARQSADEFTAKDKAVLLGVTALELFQLSPGNEILLTTVGGNVLHETGNIATTSVAVGATTGSLELAIGLGVAYGLDKFRPAVQILGDRYVSRPSEPTGELSAKQKAGKAASLYGVAFLGGAAGATIYGDLKEKGKPFKENVKTAALASGMLMVSNTVITSVLTGTARATEAAGVEDATAIFADTIRNPLVPATVVGLAFAAVKWRERRKALASIRQANEDLSLTVTPKATKQSLMNRIFKRSQGSSGTSRSQKSVLVATQEGK